MTLDNSGDILKFFLETMPVNIKTKNQTNFVRSKLFLRIPLAVCLILPINLVIAEVSQGQDLGRVRNAVERGAQFLYENQNAAGWWSNANLPALAALAMVALDMAGV
ncbi:MAG: hypothetical protein VYE44_01265, partial [Verrucomicrobiota bacterium]|nr:hypothetical protein [Verrucomicrobiota bacterium]